MGDRERTIMMKPYEANVSSTYWGMGTPLYCAWNDEGETHYFRAANRVVARSKFPNARFYR